MARFTDIQDAADLPLIPSKHTTSEIVFNGPCVYKGHTVTTDEINNLDVEVFDGNPGVSRGNVKVVGADLQGGLMLGGYVRIEDHLRLVFTGTIGSGHAIVYFNDYDANP